MPTDKSGTEYPRWTGLEVDTQDYGTLFYWTSYGFSPLKSQVIEIKAPESPEALGFSLGLQLSNTEAVIELLKEGLTMNSFEHLSEAIEISTAQLAAVTRIARRTLARRKEEGRLQFIESERVFRLASLFDKAVAALGDEQAKRWFKTPLKALGGRAPLEYSDTEVGAREVEDLLGRLKHGVFS